MSNAEAAEEIKTLSNKKPGTGNPLHTQELVTVASFRTWRGWRECVARDRYLTLLILTKVRASLAAAACLRDKCGRPHML